MPVLTPYELEIGLGAREWTSSLLTNYEYGALETCGGPAWEDLLEKVKVYNRQEGEEEEEEVVDNQRGQDDDPSDTGELGHSTVLMLRRKEEENAIMEFQSSGAVQYYQSRQYKGLVPGVHTEDTDKDINIIHDGQHGIASIYK